MIEHREIFQIDRLKIFISFLLVTVAIIIVSNDAYKIKNGYMLNENLLLSSVYLSDVNHERFSLSFKLEELKKIFWWQAHVDMELGRLATAAFQLFDVKFRAWLFQYIPPNPAISLSWLFGLIFIPLLLFNFLRRYIGLGGIGSAAIIVLFLVSPATIGYTFQNYHAGKMLAVFFTILILNICLTLNDLTLSQYKDNKKESRALIFLGITLYLSLFTDPYIFVIFLLIPIFFPKLFKEPFCNISMPPTEKTEAENRHRHLLRYLIGVLPRLSRSIYMVVFSVIAWYFLILFFVIPWLSGKAGYPYGFFSLTNSITGTGGSPFRGLFDPKFYGAVFVNMYWFVIGNVGLRKYLPLYAGGLDSFGSYYVIVHYVSLLTFFLFNIVMVGICYISYQFSSQKKYIFYCLAALYVTMGWVTLIHCTFNCYTVAVWSNYYYGSVLSIAFAIFLGALLNSFKKYKGIYALITITIFISSYPTYAHSKELNQIWKNFRYPSVDIDGFYREYQEYWYSIKAGSTGFNTDLCKIDGEIRTIFQAPIIHPQHHNYTNLLRYAALNKEFVKAVNFAVFCKDISPVDYRKKRDYMPVATGFKSKPNISDGDMAANDLRFNYEREEKLFKRLITIAEAKRIVLTDGRLTTSSSNENRGNLVDGDPSTFWHVKHPREEVIVFVDIGMKSERQIRVPREPIVFVDIDLERERQVKLIRILPREKSNGQMWGGRGAFWLGSNDRHKWRLIAGLDVDVEFLKETNERVLGDDDWINFILPEDSAFRYYRLKIIDPAFLSFAEIQLLE